MTVSHQLTTDAVRMYSMCCQWTCDCIWYQCSLSVLFVALHDVINQSTSSRHGPGRLSMSLTASL